MKISQTILLLPEDLKRQFKIRAAEQGRTMTEIGIELIKEYLIKSMEIGQEKNVKIKI